jgi:3-isopropylmalate/(R)-2-methylmalate dehydratase large subunit
MMRMPPASSPHPSVLPGRVLYLSTSLATVRAQVDNGALFTRTTAGGLRDDVSTDEISPVAIMAHFDHQLARYPYTGLQVEGERPIGVGAVQRGGFSVVVAGRRYGKGSSREHSPTAEQRAGVQLVFADSFERIYRQNADNIGLFTSTRLDLLDQLERGEPLTHDDLLADRDPAAAAILRAGGLLGLGQRLFAATAAAPDASRSHHTDTVPVPVPVPVLVPAAAEPQTLYQKIVARHRLALPDTPAAAGLHDACFVRADWRFIHEYYTGMAAHMLDQYHGDRLVLHEPEHVVVFEDHTAYMSESPAHARNGLLPNLLAMCQAQRDFVARFGLRCHRTLHDCEQDAAPSSASAGISHAMMAEHYALPGQVVAGTDSHTPHSGALGCVAVGVGTTDMANALVTGAVRLPQAQSLRIDLHGPLAPGITAKDIVLHLLALPGIRAGLGVGKVFEFAGSAIAQLSTDERATLTNMTAELGGLTGIVAPDAETLRFLQQRRGLHLTLEPWMCSDPGAPYAACIVVDCTALRPLVAAPGDPGNGQPLHTLGRRVHIDIAYGGSCTAGKRDDFDHYHAVLAWGLEQGLRLPSHVQLFLQYGTTAVRDYCIAQGYDRTFAAMGARVLQPTCGACANCGPGSSTEATQVTISAINRNFPGRSGPGQVWLASPPTVMASALAGYITSWADLQAQLPR